MATQVRLGSVEQIPVGEGRTFKVGTDTVAVFRTREGRVFATQSHCPHRMGPLSDGILGGARLTCPLHEWTFDLDSGAPVQGDCGIKVYPVACAADGTLVLELD